MQVDLFADFDPPPAADPKDEPGEVIARVTAAIAALPEKLLPTCTPATPAPETKPELDAWTRYTQRIYLLYLVGACQSMTYRDSSIANTRYVLQKLNGMAGEW